MTFTVPSFALGNGKLYRISASDIANRNSPFTCPMGLSLKARNKERSVQPNDPDRSWPDSDPTRQLTFAIDAGFDALQSGMSVPEATGAADERLTHSQRRFLSHALSHLEELVEAASSAAGVTYQVGHKVQSASKSDDAKGDITVWAIHLQTADRQVHELVRLRLKPLKETRPQELDWAATAALALAFDDATPPTALLRISDFSLADGQLRLAFDGDRQTATQVYLDRGRPLQNALNGSAFRPGSACSDCAFVAVCPALPKRRGALGIPGRSVARRHLTATDLHAYARCPTAFLVQRRDHLPDAYGDTADHHRGDEARSRGLAVHAWLDWAHSRQPPVECSTEDLPLPTDPDLATKLGPTGLEPEDYRIAYPFLVQHLPRCSLGLEGLFGWATERRHVIYDPDADVVLISTPDLVCEVGIDGDRVWRETKTSMVLPPDLDAAMTYYPAFAFNIVLLAAEAQATRKTGHAELEVLTPASSAIYFVATTDGDVVAAAQRHVAAIGMTFAADIAFDRRVTAACTNCSAHQWCDPPTDVSRPAPVPEDDQEFFNFAEPF